MKITIKLINGKRYTVYIDNYQTVLSLKYKLEETLNIKKGMQRLLYNGSPLTNEFNLNNLPNNSILHLILQLESIPE